MGYDVQITLLQVFRHHSHSGGHLSHMDGDGTANSFLYTHRSKGTVACCVMHAIVSLSCHSPQSSRPEVRTVSNTTCTMYLYNEPGNECTQYLQQYTKCLDNSSTDVFVAGPLNQMSLTKATSLIQQLRSFPSQVRPQCMKSLEPFICLHFIHLCYNETVIRPSEQQCNNITSVCDKELEVVKRLPLTDIDVSKYLSNCAQSSPLDDKACDVQSITNHTISSVNCSEGYYRTTNGTCLPECSVWTPYSRRTLLTTDIMAIFAVVIAVIFGVADLFLSCVRCHKM